MARSCVAVLAGALLLVSLAAAAEPDDPECIAPARPGGGFDLTCKLARSALNNSKLLTRPLRISYMPGGIGAVAYNTVVAQRPADGNIIVAFSGGSLLNLAQGKFGKYNVNDVRWLAGVGADYGMIAVRADSPYQNLKQLVAAVKAHPSEIVFGAGGTVGSQDWIKTVLIARQAGVSHQQMRYVAFEGGGETTTALLGGHIQAASGDLSEVMPQLDQRKIRVLAVMSDKRLPGRLSGIPTAREQGFDIVWPIIRGFYVGPKVSAADYAYWETSFRKVMATPEFARLREGYDLFPFSLTGAQMDAYVKRQVKEYRKIATQFGLVYQTL
ncbi:tripartite tricarboxylate transporter substrate binding protein [Vogesella sp. AC12]|uniref:tripartite tricarboxylate transporter substrate binding protein n=1 Tax=Vogesella sp. AC12 TaxID=2950550 RepID=UPI00210EB259|nr:tripartite tricarboxylate transporter substrate binding protein [Vogesella sp. AC12]MCQ4143528.1 tripartite tricarboxylate transporter substrate binding protein [Vogesella sp. AC12]